MEFSFHIYNKLAADGAAMAIDRLLRADINKKTRGAGTSSNEISPLPVIVCVGSDLAIGDSLGPIVGSMLKYKTQNLNLFVYGTLSAPVTAKELPYMRSFLKETHPRSQILAVDAAVGEKGDIGLIRITDSPLLPGAGAGKKLDALGDVAVMGIVAEKSLSNYGLLNTTRLNLVYTMAETLSDGLATLLWERASGEKKAEKNA
ncbi:MAG: spore protease YyaC [Clostridiales bacterium]|nr:spore protease YyaC [Clostridiales bacterium]